MLQRQAYIVLEEESSFGTAASPTMVNPVYVQPRSFVVNFNPVFLRLEFADGGRDAARRFMVARAYEWSATIPTHPIDNGWWWKWVGGQTLTINQLNGEYRHVLAGPNIELPSFTIYGDPRIEDYIATGEQTFQFLGAKVGSLQLEFAGGDDQMAMLTMSGILQKPKETGDVLDGVVPMGYVPPNLDLSAQWTPYYFKNFITSWASAGFSGANNWKRGMVRIENTLVPRSYADESTDLYIDDILLGARRVIVEFDKDAKDAMTRLNNLHNDVNQKLEIRTTHPTGRGEGSPSTYQELYTFPSVGIDEGNPMFQAQGADEIADIIFRAEAQRAAARVEINPGNDSSSSFNITTLSAWTSGSAGDGWAWETVIVTTGHLTRVGIPLSTDSAETVDFTLYVVTDDGGSPSAPSVMPGGIVAGGTSNVVKGEMLTTTKQMIYFDFPYAPKLTGAAAYWFVLTADGTTSSVNIFGNSTGTDSQVTSADGGATWSSDTNARAAGDLHFDDIIMIIDQYIDDAKTYFPDAV